MDLRAFESILIFLSEEEIEELHAAINERMSRKLTRNGEDCSGSVEYGAAALSRSDRWK